MTRSSLLLAALVALGSLSTSAAEAQASLPVHAIAEGGVRVDGALGDWRRVRFTRIGEGDDAVLDFALGYDERGLYFAGRVLDQRLVRTRRPGVMEDAVIVTLAFPSGRRGGLVGHDLYLFAGVTGRSPGSAALTSVNGRRLRPISSARVVEGPLDRGVGYVLEAFVPWSALPGSERWESGRGSVRLRDVDQEARPTVVAEPALVPVDPRRLDALLPLAPSGGRAGSLAAFAAERGIADSRPSHDLRGDVTGDGRPDRVAILDRYVVVSGPSLGERFAFHTLAVERRSDVRSAELVDLTGNGRAELVVVLRQRSPEGERDLWRVLSFVEGRPSPIFGVEVRKATRAGSIENRITLQRARRGPATIEHQARPTRELDAESYREAPATDAEPILLPWGPIASRRYRWDGQRFARIGERPNPRYRPPEEAPARAPTRAAAPEPAAEPPSQEALLALFRRERGIARNARPRFRVRADLAGGGGPETALVYGRKLVVVGPGVADGASYFYFEIPTESDADVLDVSALTLAPGQVALGFRVRQRMGEVEREVLLVHRLTGRGFPRLVALEVARRQGNASVENAVRAGGGGLEVRPGRARGFGPDHWPFAEGASGGVEPLLLPWRDRPTRYRLRGDRLTR